MTRTQCTALAFVIFAVGLANADRLGGAGAEGRVATAAKARDMPANDDFNSITFRAGAGGSSPSCCPADLDCNGFIEAADLAVVLGSWGSCAGCAADLDANGTVDAGDLAVVLSGWGACAG